MKKLKLNSTLIHKATDFRPHEVSVEKVITLYGREFEHLKNHPLRDNAYIAENRDLMYIDSSDIAHCLLFVDYNSGDGMLVESEGSGYARKSQFIPNAKALLKNNEITDAETRLHESLKEIVDKIAELAHCGEKNFVFEEMLEKSDLDLKSLLRDSVTEMLCEREDIQMAESINVDISYQPDIKVEGKHYSQSLCSFINADEEKLCKPSETYRLIFQPSDFRNHIYENCLFYAVCSLYFINGWN